MLYYKTSKLTKKSNATGGCRRMNATHILRILRQSLGVIFNRQPDPRHLLNELMSEFSRKCFQVERCSCEEWQCEGIQGIFIPYPLVSAWVVYKTSERTLEGLLCFEQGSHYNLIPIDLCLKLLTRQRPLSLTDNPAEIVRQLHVDALSLGRALAAALAA